MNRIESLTADQQARMPEYVQQWTAIGLSTEPADRHAAGSAIFLLYSCAGLKPPQQIVWRESPFALLARDVSGEVSTSASLPKRRGTSECIYGQHDAGWLSFYAFMREVVGLRDQTEKITGLLALAKCAGWAMPYEHTCYVSERHNVLHRDNAGRLHCLTGAAVAYPDGWSVYAVRGVRIPKEWITGRDTLDPMLALTEPNLERRGAAALIIGWDKVLAKLQPRIIDADPDPHIGSLLDVDLPGEPGQKFLRAKCGTGRDIVLRVPPTVRSAQEAGAWSYGLDTTVYNLEGRT